MVLSAIVGVVLGVASILLTRTVRGEHWLYSAPLILLPLAYTAFAAAAGDVRTATLELMLGAPFILGGAACLAFRIPRSAVFVGVLWITHAIFDVVHDYLLVNPGVPGWYPTFCAAIDVVIGVYVVRFSRGLRGNHSSADAATTTRAGR
jgi:hypothetical protein